ncbi:hypothetical protein HDV63DRAFT_408208 [Trichoderma sp. SZMC 28014]
MDPILPEIDLTMDPSWYWLNDKFGLEPEELFTTLHDRFNTKKFPLQDPVTFHRDVYDCANNAETRDEFYSKLEERKAQRIKEMNRAWRDVSCWLAAFPQNMFCQLCYDEETMELKLKEGSLNDNKAERWEAFTQFTRTMSFDSMVRFFDGFARDERKVQKDFDRMMDEKWNRFMRERAAKRLDMETGAQDDKLFFTSHGQQESSRDVSPLDASSSPVATISDESRSTSSSARRSPNQPEALAQARTAENSRRRKRRSDEDANGSKTKKRRVMNEGAEDVDAERPAAAQHEQMAAEATPTLKQAEKRKRVDDSKDSINKKRRKIIKDLNPSLTQTPDAAELYKSAPDTTPSKAASSLGPTAVPPSCDPDMMDEGIQPSSPASTDDDLSFATAPSSPKEDTGVMATNPALEEYTNTEPLQQRNQASPQQDGDGLVANISTISTDTRELNRKPRTPRRQRSNKRRSPGEGKSLTPKRQTRQRKVREQNASPLVQNILRSSRASRRDPAQELWFLDDNNTICAMAGNR